MRLPPLVQRTWDSPGSAPQGGQFGFVYDHSKVVALQIVVGNMLDVYAVEKPPENSPTPPPRFTRMPSESELTRVCSCSWPPPSRVSAARRGSERGAGTEPTLRSSFAANEGSAAREAASRIEPRAPASPAHRRAGLRAECALGATRADGQPVPDVRQTPVHVHGGLAGAASRAALVRNQRGAQASLPTKAAPTVAARDRTVARRLLPLSAAGRTRRTRSRGDAPERPSGHGARVILRGHTSPRAPTSRAKRASGQESRHVRRTPVHGQGGFAGAARARRRRRADISPARRRSVAARAGAASRMPRRTVSPLGVAAVRAPRRMRSRGRTRTAGRSRRVRQTPVHVQGGPGCSWPAPPPARAPRAQRRAVPVSPTQRQLPLPPVQEQGPPSSALPS
jgi:hypothetical protein